MTPAAMQRRFINFTAKDQLRATLISVSVAKNSARPTATEQFMIGSRGSVYERGARLGWSVASSSSTGAEIPTIDASNGRVASCAAGRTRRNKCTTQRLTSPVSSASSPVGRDRAQRNSCCTAVSRMQCNQLITDATLPFESTYSPAVYHCIKVLYRTYMFHAYFTIKVCKKTNIIFLDLSDLIRLRTLY